MLFCKIGIGVKGGMVFCVMVGGFIFFFLFICVVIGRIFWILVLIWVVSFSLFGGFLI